jgi:hypothetical protein
LHWSDFELERELGRGATARVWLARRKSTGEKLCLKVFHPGLGEATEKRILREAEIASKLVHPNLVRLFGRVEGGESAALAMELLEGGNLETFQASLPYVLPEVSVAITIQILKALELAHSMGVVHRDLKPANVLLDGAGRVAVTDFGLARVTGSDLTASLGVMGSVDYMSPEQVSGDELEGTSDLFSVASLLYFLVTGTRPFSRATSVAVMAAIRNEPAEPPQKRNPKVSVALSRLLMKGLHKSPGERFESARAFREALESYLAEAGLADLELSAWRKDPPAATMQALEAAARALAVRAEEQLAAGQWGPFLETLGHLSIKAPSAPAVSRLTDEYRKARRRRRKFVWLAWGGTGVAAVLALALLLPKRPPSPAPREGPPSPVSKGVGEGKAVRPTASVRPPSPGPARVAPSPKVGQVKFQVPDSVSVYWDGKRVDTRAGIEPQKLGPHWVLLEREGFEPIRAKVEVRAQTPTVIKVD